MLWYNNETEWLCRINSFITCLANELPEAWNRNNWNLLLTILNHYHSLGKLQQTTHCYFPYFSQKIGFDISCKLGDNLHKMLNSIFWKRNKKNISKCSLLKFLSSMRNVNKLPYAWNKNYQYWNLLLNLDMPCLSKQCRSRSAGFFRSQLIWIYTVYH